MSRDDSDSLRIRCVMQVSRFLEAWLTGTSPVQYTPAGLAWASEWGTLRYTMNAALIAEVWSQHIASMPLLLICALHDPSRLELLLKSALFHREHLTLCTWCI